jgi:hypothetical protein
MDMHYLDLLEKGQLENRESFYRYRLMKQETKEFDDYWLVVHWYHVKNALKAIFG